MTSKNRITLYANKIIVVLLFFAAFSTLFYRFQALQSILMVLLGFVSLLKLFSEKIVVDARKLIFLSSCFFIILTNILYFNSSSLKSIGESIILFFIPILIFNENILKNRNKILLVYSVSIFALCIYIIRFYISYIPHHKYDWYLARFFIEYNLKFHSTYIGLWIGVSLLFLTDYFIKEKVILIGKLAILVIIICQISTLILLNTRMALYSLVIIFLINSVLFLSRKQKVISLVVMSLIVILIIAFTDRYKKDIEFIVENSIKKSERYDICLCSLNEIMKSPFLGNNTVNIEKNLNQCYRNLGRNKLANDDINSHNQYLNFFLRGGILLFVAFIYSLYLKLKMSLKTNQNLYFSITLFFVFSFLTENVLVRQYGVFIYFFTDALFLGSIFIQKTNSCDKVEKT